MLPFVALAFNNTTNATALSLSTNPPTTVPLPGSGGTATDNSATGAIGPLTAAVCNQACGVCDNSGVALSATSPIKTNQATCTPPGSSCFARTPGYWAEKWEVAQSVINTSGGCAVGSTTCPTSTVFNCGLQIVTGEAAATTPFINDSSTEDLCSIGTDNKLFDKGIANVGVTGSTAKGWTTSPDQMQLIRQCMAAELNLKASAQTTGPAFDCETAFPNINEIYGGCCAASSICSSGTVKTNDTVTVGTITYDCLTALDSFNGSFEGTSNPPNLAETSADPIMCQNAKNNGFANHGAGRLYGPGK